MVVAAGDWFFTGYLPGDCKEMGMAVRTAWIFKATEGSAGVDGAGAAAGDA
jgi:hypothetical protein